MKQLSRVFQLTDNKNNYRLWYILCHWALYQPQISNKKRSS